MSELSQKAREAFLRQDYNQAAQLWYEAEGRYLYLSYIAQRCSDPLRAFDEIGETVDLAKDLFTQLTGQYVRANDSSGYDVVVAEFLNCMSILNLNMNHAISDLYNNGQIGNDIFFVAAKTVWDAAAMINDMAQKMPWLNDVIDSKTEEGMENNLRSAEGLVASLNNAVAAGKFHPEISQKDWMTTTIEECPDIPAYGVFTEAIGEEKPESKPKTTSFGNDFSLSAIASQGGGERLGSANTSAVSSVMKKDDVVSTTTRPVNHTGASFVKRATPSPKRLLAELNEVFLDHLEKRPLKHIETLPQASEKCVEYIQTLLCEDLSYRQIFQPIADILSRFCTILLNALKAVQKRYLSCDNGLTSIDHSKMLDALVDIANAHLPLLKETENLTEKFPKLDNILYILINQCDLACAMAASVYVGTSGNELHAPSEMYRGLLSIEGDLMDLADEHNLEFACRFELDETQKEMKEQFCELMDAIDKNPEPRHKEGYWQEYMDTRERLRDEMMGKYASGPYTSELLEMALDGSVLEYMEDFDDED